MATEFDTRQLYELAPPPVGDAAGLGAWDTGVPKDCRGLLDGSTLPERTVRVSADPEPFVGVWVPRPVDRLQLFLTSVEKTTGSPAASPSLRLEIRAGVGSTTQVIASGIIAAGKPYATLPSRLLCVSGFLATRWELWLWSASTDPVPGEISAKIRMILDRVGGGTIVVDKSTGNVT